MAELDQQFIEYVVKNLVDHPDEVVIERSIDDRGVLLRLTVHPDDMGKIIGKAGSTAKAIRTLLRVVGAKSDERLNLKIVDRDGDENSDPTTVQTNPANDVAATNQTEAEPATDPQPTEAPESNSDQAVEAIKAKAREGLDDLDIDI